MRFPAFQTKTGTIAIIAVAVVLVAAGAYAGAFWSERQSIQRALNDSFLQIALNLESNRYIRDGKPSDAIGLINTNIDTKLAYLMHHDGLESRDPAFTRRKKNVMTALSRERTIHPPALSNKNGSFYSDPEWLQYQREVENYLKQSTREKSDQ